jgi:phosphoglycerate dehydrogenase-like enzyme
VLDDYQGLARRFGAWHELAQRIELVVVDTHLADDDVLVAALGGADVVLAMRERTRFPRERLERLDGLGLMVTRGMRNAAIDLDAAGELGITVAGTSSPGTPTAELTWALILALARHVVVEDRSLKAAGWQHTLGIELEGRTLGIIGLGKLGSRVAAIGQAFGMRVVAWSQHLDADRARARGVEPLGKDELLATSDVVTIHTRLSERTRGLIGADELATMRPTAYLVNTSRGPIVDEAALVAALREGVIAGAGLDVFDVEPLPVHHPLRTSPNVVLTPHLGYVTEEGMAGFYREVVPIIADWLDGRAVRQLPRD